MGGRYLSLGIVLCALLAFRLDAATVSFMVIETGLPAESGASRYAGLWESGLLDVFFEAGHIVSNAPILRLPQKPQAVFPEEARPDFNKALEGGAEYLILALLEYDSPADTGGTPAAIQKPRNIFLRIFRTRPEKLLYEQHYADKAPLTLKDEYDSIKKAAQTLIPHINDR